MTNELNWSVVGETVAQGFASNIPVVGGAVTFLLGEFWPGSGNSIWSEIQEQVQTLIDAAILQAEYQQDQESIDGLKETLLRYLDDEPPQKGDTLTGALQAADLLYAQLTESSNAIHLIPLTVALSHLHLLILAEQNQHGTVIFSSPNQPPGVYNTKWGDQLTEQRLNYKSFFEKILDQWWSWRRPLIYSEYGRTWAPIVWSAHGKGVDDHANLETYYSDSSNSNGDTFKDVAIGIETMYARRAWADMASALSSTFLLNLYDPVTAGDPPDVNPKLAIFSLGPFSPGTLGMDKFGTVNVSQTDVPGKVTAFTIQSGNSIDLIQLHYQGHDGIASGPGSNGGPGLVSVPKDDYCTGFNVQIMFSIIANFSKANPSGPYGNAGQWSGNEGNGVAGPSYALCGAGYATGPGPRAVGIMGDGGS
jgi:hypothetical protein